MFTDTKEAQLRSDILTWEKGRIDSIILGKLALGKVGQGSLVRLHLGRSTFRILFYMTVRPALRSKHRSRSVLTVN